MKLCDLTIEHLEIPLKVSFSHASATRSVTDSALVRANTDHHIGYGESCPRDYVTNETYESIAQYFEKHKVALLASVTDFQALCHWVNSHQEEIDKNPAAWCCIELAILDLLARESSCTVESILSLPELSGDYAYTAVLGNSSIETFSDMYSQYITMGFTDFKLKLSGDINLDRSKCELLSSQSQDLRVRLDANNYWKDSEEAIRYLKILGYPFFAIEEPIQALDYGGMSHIADELTCKVILDESFIQLQQFDEINANKDKWIINIRISKMGGLLRSLAIAQKAKNEGIDCIVGAQVGETSLLTRAALTLVNAYREIVIAQEGGYGTYLLKQDICDPVLMFDKGGILSESLINRLSDSGFGLAVDSE